MIPKKAVPFPAHPPIRVSPNGQERGGRRNILDIRSLDDERALGQKPQGTVFEKRRGHLVVSVGQFGKEREEEGSPLGRGHAGVKEGPGRKGKKSDPVRRLSRQNLSRRSGPGERKAEPLGKKKKGGRMHKGKGHLPGGRKEWPKVANRDIPGRNHAGVDGPGKGRGRTAG